MPRQDSDRNADIIRDLGCGTKVMRESALRLLNRDGTFNVSRGGLPLFKSLNLYQALLSIPWWQFNLTFVGLYLLTNLLFATLYFFCGPQALSGLQATSNGARLLECFFFSVQTLTTVGFGHISPHSLAANFLVVLEAFLGLSGFAVAAALMFARFARPRARILFSNRAVIGPYHGTTCFEFRIANGSPNELIEVEVRILLCMTETRDGVRITLLANIELLEGFSRAAGVVERHRQIVARTKQPRAALGGLARRRARRAGLDRGPRRRRRRARRPRSPARARAAWRASSRARWRSREPPPARPSTCSGCAGSGKAYT